MAGPAPRSGGFFYGFFFVFGMGNFIEPDSEIVVCGDFWNFPQQFKVDLFTTPITRREDLTLQQR